MINITQQLNFGNSFLFIIKNTKIPILEIGMLFHYIMNWVKLVEIK